MIHPSLSALHICLSHLVFRFKEWFVYTNNIDGTLLRIDKIPNWCKGRSALNFVFRHQVKQRISEQSQTKEPKWEAQLWSGRVITSQQAVSRIPKLSKSTDPGREPVLFIFLVYFRTCCWESGNTDCIIHAHSSEKHNERSSNLERLWRRRVFRQ